MILSPSGDLAFFLTAIPAVILLGLSKGGFSGLSSLAMPLMALAVSPVKAAAIVLPILIVQDWVSVWAFRRDFDLRNLAILIPGAAVGVAAGWLLAARVDEQAVRLAVGLISVGFVVFMIVRDRLAGAEPTRANVAPGLFWGAIAGFTSFVSHAGAPPMMVYVLPQRLAPRIFAGTSAFLFAAINLLKVGPYFLLGQFSPENLTASAWLLPVAVASTFAGVWLVRRVSSERFYLAVLILTFVIGVKLIWDGATGLLA
ncbi:MAG: sulfite exporter TauE/SafE family protein [Bradyrhizobium sp.]|nr:MAG: sulfite exporter TauE/SafE family protein [Bradyrhizobium sp.]